MARPVGAGCWGPHHGLYLYEKELVTHHLATAPSSRVDISHLETLGLENRPGGVNSDMTDCETAALTNYDDENTAHHNTPAAFSLHYHCRKWS
jgi:hypothetical protein